MILNDVRILAYLGVSALAFVDPVQHGNKALGLTPGVESLLTIFRSDGKVAYINVAITGSHEAFQNCLRDFFAADKVPTQFPGVTF